MCLRDGVSQSILGVNDLERGLSSSQITVDVYVHSVGSNSDSQVHVWSFVRARARINIFGRSWTIVTSATLFSVSLEDHPVVDWKRLRMYSLTIHACFDSSHLLQVRDRILTEHVWTSIVNGCGHHHLLPHRKTHSPLLSPPHPTTLQPGIIPSKCLAPRLCSGWSNLVDPERERSRAEGPA